ncbi:carnitine acetyl transferase [Apiospora phragmitis]|uniref:Carnitine acetyl transferase n=1 Tax=Apiospora phragmitis TaxID=2905665 RepID=A0ABR1WT17_9PEZI
MPTQVRIFSMPKSLGETLAGGGSASVPRSVPDLPEISSTAHEQSTQTTPPSRKSDMPRSQGITFAAQDDLPKLPIPSLDQSAQKYLAALKPLQGPREHAETKQAVQEFLKIDGPELQEKLQQSRNQTLISGYDSYLNFDNPVVLNLNPFFLLEDDPTPARNNQVTRAASLVVSSLNFVRAVRREELPPDTVKGKPLDMYQYSRLFGTARVPTVNGCQIEQDPDSRHIVVLCHGQFYWFDVFDDNSDLIMGEKDLSINLQTIIDDAAQTPIQEAAKSALGILSTENRKTWSGLRDVLLKEEGSNNADSLGIVDSALFILCLDYTEPDTAARLCQNMLCGTNEVERGIQVGTCINRWYDKLQIIVCKNGSAGINFEHTGVDGHTVLRFASDVFTDTILRFARTINGGAPSLWKTTSPDPSKRDPDSFGDVNTTPHKLEWDMLPELSIAVRFAETRLADLIGQNEFACLDFGGYGKNFITSMGFSPDAFVQMAFQAAYYGLYGRIECTYEPAMTKVFLHGRTEAIRSVSEESVNFVQTFWGDNPLNRRRAAASPKHWVYQFVREWLGSGHEFPQWEVQGRDYSIISQDGEIRTRGRVDSTGSSRSRDHPVPSIFSDPGWDKLNNTILSTSNCGNPSLRHFGFGPTSGDGFGIGYIIKDDVLSICVSSKHRQTKRFIDTFESYLLEIRRILRITNRRATSSKQTRAREIDPTKPTKGVKGFKARGRLITGHEAIRRRSHHERHAVAYRGQHHGFFDAGMLLQALKARGEALDGGEVKASEKARRRDVGKKLRLVEY